MRLISPANSTLANIDIEKADPWQINSDTCRLPNRETCERMINVEKSSYHFYPDNYLLGV